MCSPRAGMFLQWWIVTEGKSRYRAKLPDAVNSWFNYGQAALLSGKWREVRPFVTAHEVLAGIIYYIHPLWHIDIHPVLFCSPSTTGITAKQRRPSGKGSSR
jgi:hypothetical protein